MSTRADQSFWALSEKEKQTLRLIVRGHDAKSIARSLDLSVHTINERLRDARRKMAVSSSREAARLLLEAEGSGSGSPNPDFFGDTEIGEDATCPGVDRGNAPNSGVWRAYRHPWIIAGVLLMTFALALLAFTAVPPIASAPSLPPTASRVAPDSEVVNLARQWLVLIDQGRWNDSYQATSASFRRLNTLQLWAETSENVRTPLGAVISRTFLSEETLPAPPRGYQVVKFRTRFAAKADVVETVTLDREDGSWRVVGVMIE